MSDKSNAFIEQFIQIYRQHPALWKVKSKSYSDRNLREKAFGKLLEHYKSVNQSANIDTVKKKINNLRSSFRKELKKVKASKKSGCLSEDIYISTLWYYDLLLFTADQEERRETTSSAISQESEDDSDKSDNEIDENVENVSQSPSYLQPDTPKSGHSEASTNGESASTASRKRKNPSMIQQMNKKSSCEEKKLKLLQLAEKTLLQPEDMDEYRIAGQRIGFQLKSMTEKQRVIAEKLISDIIYYGRMEELTEDAAVTCNSMRNFSRSSYNDEHSGSFPQQSRDDSQYVYNNNSQSESETQPFSEYLSFVRSPQP